MPGRDTRPPPLPRDQFRVADEVVYLDTAYASPLPYEAASAVATDALGAGQRGSASIEERLARLAPLRATAGALLGFPADDIALVANTTHGLGLVAAGLDWRPGDVVLVPAADHPTTVLPWRAQEHRGVQVVPVRGSSGEPSSVLADLLAALESTPRVRVVALSWVDAATGERTDLPALAEAVHAVGALLCVDAIQGAGVLPAAMEAWGVDAVAAGAQKWMIGPHGIGALAVTPALRERLALLWASKASLAGGVVPDEPVVPVASAARFEAGAPSHLATAAWLGGLRVHGCSDLQTIWQWADELAERLAAGAADSGLTVLSPRDRSRRSTLVTVAVPGIPAATVVERLAAADVVASARGGGVRFSPAGWNHAADIDAALAALAAL